MDYEPEGSDLSADLLRTFASIYRESSLKRREIETENHLFKKWRKIIPSYHFSIIEATLTPSSFRKGFISSLKNATFNEFLKQKIINSPTSPYIIRSSKNYVNRRLQNLKANLSNQKLDEISEAIKFFSRDLKNDFLPDTIRTYYQHKVKDTLQFIKSVKKIGEVEFTLLHQSAYTWRSFIDIDKSKQYGMLFLKYEEAAEEMLRKTENNSVKKPSIGEVIDFWQFTQNELNYIDLSDQYPISPATGKRMIEVLLNRLSLLSDWSAHIAPAASMYVNAHAKEMIIPQDRYFSTSDLLYATAHELVHITHGENSDRQPLKILSQGRGWNDFMTEGISVMMELAISETLAHYRQKIFAGRYLAVAMALKAKPENGELKAVYSYQDIYDRLVGFNLKPNDAARVVWRVARGTSLLRLTTELEIYDPKERLILPVAEAFTKDIIYFTGRLEICRWLKEWLGMSVSVCNNTTPLPDHKDTLLGKGLPYLHEIKKKFRNLAGMERDIILDLINFLATAKISFWDLTDKNSPWQDYLTRQNLIDIRDIFEPGKNITKLSFSPEKRNSQN